MSLFLRKLFHYRLIVASLNGILSIVLLGMPPALLAQAQAPVNQAGSQTQAVSRLQGNITSIQVVKGRSQIIKFAQPIRRVSIADPSIADIVALSPDQLMLNGKQRGVTSLIVWDEGGQEGIFDLFVENDSSQILRAIEAIAPNEAVQVKVTDDSFIVSGQASSSIVVDEIRKIAAAHGYRDNNFIDLTDTPDPQVMLEVRFAEINRDVSRQIRTSFSYNSGDFSFTRLGNAIESQVLTAAGRSTAGLRPPKPIALTQQANNFGGITGTILPSPKLKFDAAWDLLESRNQGRILAEPNLVCTHGRTANFLAGGEFPYVGGTDQNGSPLVSFREYGVKLKFTPWISLKSGRIELKVEPEVSDLDFNNASRGPGGVEVPGILKRSTATTVELLDGQSLVISGILSKNNIQSAAQVPFISQVPVLGEFFKNTINRHIDRELIVVVTPHIMDRKQYAQAP